MALYHMHADVIKKGQSAEGAVGFAKYIAREDPERSTQFYRYIGRDGTGKEDLVAKGAGGLPRWAKDDPMQFWQMADQHERGGPRRPGTVARTYEVALPRELSPEARLALAADIRTVYFERYPHSWAVHNPIDRQGQEHPHMHVMMSQRGPQDSLERSPKVYFSRAAGPEQDPAEHGIRKDRSWQGPARLIEIREGIATLTNAALERHGIEVGVSHESLEARGYNREACVYRKGEQTEAIAVQRDVLHRDVHPYERGMDWIAWGQQKQEEHIRDISRQAMVDLVRDHFWRHDRSPAREQERLESIARAIARERELTGRFFPSPTPERQRTPGRVWLPGHLDDTPQGGAHLHMDEPERSYQR